MSEYDIQVTILRDGAEIGFCGGLGDTIDHALATVAALVERRQWETAPGMPFPSEVDQ